VILTEVPDRALAVFAHPDDPEVACGGTLAAWSLAGCETHVLVCNAGDKGSGAPGESPASIAARREAEAGAAAAVLGLAGHEVLGTPDGELENDVALRGLLVARIRALRPAVVITPDPTSVFFGDSYVNHHDHRAAGWAVLDACAPMAGSPHYYPEAGPEHSVTTLLLSGTLEPDAWVDIGATLQTKVEAIRCHRSQLGGELTSELDADDVIGAVVEGRAAEAAALADAANATGARGIRYAEGFRRLTLRR
jgi:LmbE family N-acetylglucosaminyl deacetylase